MEHKSFLTSRPRNGRRRLPTLEVEIFAIVCRQRRAVAGPPKAVRDHGIDRVAILERIANAEIVEEGEVFDLPGRSVLELIPLGMSARVRNAIGPKQPAWERPDVEVEIVDLIVTSLVTEDVQSDKPEGCLMFPAVDTNVPALHEPVVDRGKHVGLRTGLCVRAPAFAKEVRAANDPAKIGDAGGLSGRGKELEMERAVIEDLRNRPGLHCSRGLCQQRGPQGRATATPLTAAVVPMNWRRDMARSQKWECPT